MASVLQVEDTVGSSWAALGAEENPQEIWIGTLVVDMGAGGGGAWRKRREGRKGCGGVVQRGQWNDPLATNPV